jgi:microcystin-dependent protein
VGPTRTLGGEAKGATLPYAGGATNLATMSPAMLASVGGSQPHNNLMPYLVLNFVIALQGIFPTRN